MDNHSPRHTLQVSQESLIDLRQQCVKFEQSCGRLDERDRELFRDIGGALRRKDTIRANIYANELAKVRHLKKVFSQSQLALECVSIRMESLLDLYNAIQLDPVSDAIKEVVGDIQGLSPEFISGLEQLTKLAGDTLKQATVGFKEPALEEAFTANPEGLAILREVSQAIESSIHEAFPEPPVPEAPSRVVQKAEEIAYGYEPASVPKRSEEKSSDMSVISNDFLNMLEGFGVKGRTKVDDVAT